MSTAAPIEPQESRVTSIMEKMLERYFPHARFLKSASIDYPTVRGQFEVGGSDYCVDTGHLNESDMVKCFNQVSYVMVADFLDRGLIAPLGRISLDEYAELYQAKKSYVTMALRRFRRPIDPSSFSGEVRMARLPKKIGKAVWLDTTYELRDNKGGRADGKVIIAIEK